MNIKIIRPAALIVPLLLIIAGLVYGAQADKGLITAGPGVADQVIAPPAIANSASGEVPNWQVISGAGDNNGSSTNFILSGTVGQTATGAGGSSNFSMNHGFWQVFGGGIEYVCGDANGDGIVNVGDAVFLINYIFKSGAVPEPECLADVNGDGIVNVGDAVYLINYIFKSGLDPVDDCCP